MREEDSKKDYCKKKKLNKAKNKNNVIAFMMWEIVYRYVIEL